MGSFSWNIYNYCFAKHKVDLLPSWGVIAGYGAAILVMTNGLGSAFGLIPDAANLIILILGGVILYPATVWALGVSFRASLNKQNKSEVSNGNI